MSLATIKPTSAAPRLPGLYGGQVAKNMVEPPVYTPSYSAITAAIPKAAAPTPKVTAAGAVAPPAGVDYSKLLGGDEILNSALAGINAQGTANTAQLTALRQRAIAQYGSVPDSLSGTLTGDVNADIDQTTRDLASEATKGGVSTVAQLQKAYDETRAAHLNSLAARGMIRSGALGQHANEDLLGFDQAGYQARQALLDYLGGAYQNYLGQQSQGQASAADATNAALQRIIAQINAGMTGGTPTPSAAGQSFPNASGGLQTIPPDAVTHVVPGGNIEYASPTQIGLVQTPEGERAQQAELDRLFPTLPLPPLPSPEPGWTYDTIGYPPQPAAQKPAAPVIPYKMPPATTLAKLLRLDRAR